MEERIVDCGPFKVKTTCHGGKIHHVVLPLTQAQWVDVASKTGESLPSCCADISTVRDLLMGALREGGSIEADDLRSLVELLREHDGYEEFRAMDLATWETQAAGIATTHQDWPFLPIGYVWFHLREQLHSHDDEPSHEDPRQVQDALWIMWKAGSSMIDTFISSDPIDMTPGHRAQRIRAIHQMLPAIHTLHDRLAEMAPESFEAVALVKRETGEVVGLDTPFVFETVELLRRRSGLDDMQPERRAKFAVHRCRVSLQKGLEVGEEIPQPDEPPVA